MTEFQKSLRGKMHTYVRMIYQLTKKFPQNELYGVISQLRRATVSIILNYIEGYARRRPAVQLNFLETAYGSLQESKYLIYLSQEESWVDTKEYELATALAEEIGAMLWTTIKSLRKK